MLDDLDKALIHALYIDGRAPFSRIAAALDVSTQTVSRRYQGLRVNAALRVVGLADPHRSGHAQWMVRLTASPQTASDVAHALVRRSDTSWVNVTSGGNEIVAIVHTPNNAATSNSLLIRDIPLTASIGTVSAHRLLHTYLGGPTAWRGGINALNEHQQRQLQLQRDANPPLIGRALSDTDNNLLAALHRDGRASHAYLAAVTGWSPATVARRLAALQASKMIFFDVEIDPALYGVTTKALLWMAVTPKFLDQVARVLAQHEELAFVAATTGRTNLVAQALCTDPAALHHYLVHRLGSIEAIHSLESAPVLRTLKAAGPILPATAPAPRRPVAVERRVVRGA